MKLKSLLSIICLWACFPMEGLACQFDVRETGFVDLGDGGYTFYGYVNDETSADTVSAFKRISAAALIDTNVNVEIVNLNSQKEHPALAHLRTVHPDSYPAGILMSPGGRPFVLDIARGPETLEQQLRGEEDAGGRPALRESLNRLASSPKREEILKHICGSLAVILFIESADSEGNAKAQKVISATIENIASQMKQASYTATGPPALVVLNRESFRREKVLLWSLGLEANEPEKPCAALLYGRARWIGPLMRGEEISERNLLGLLSAVAADCECGFDASWTRGTMLPVRWDEGMRSRAAKALGFDPENPMVKMEVSSILRTEYAASGLPFGYVELSAGSDEQERTEAAPPGGRLNDEKTETRSPVAPPASFERRSPPLPESKLRFSKPLYLMGGLAVVVLAVGLVILVRVGARKP